MREIAGDIFDLGLSQGFAIVIPTNIGWRRDGSNVMGAGIAKQAANIWPTLPAYLGVYYKRHRESSEVIGSAVFAPSALLIAFPVKPLAKNPSLSWQQPASLELIARSAEQLQRLIAGQPQIKAVAVPRVGCGNGGLDWAVVKPILEQHLTDPRFVFIAFQSSQDAKLDEYEWVDV